MLGIVLVVLFTMVMFLWLLTLIGASEQLTKASPWFAWFACLFLGIVVFLTGAGIIVWTRP